MWKREEKQRKGKEWNDNRNNYKWNTNKAKQQLNNTSTKIPQRNGTMVVKNHFYFIFFPFLSKKKWKKKNQQEMVFLTFLNSLFHFDDSVGNFDELRAYSCCVSFCIVRNRNFIKWISLIDWSYNNSHTAHGAWCTHTSKPNRSGHKH